MQIELSERQQQTVASALTIVSAFVILMAVGALFWLVGSFVSRFSSVFLPLAVAVVAALVFKPYFGWLRRFLRLPPVVALIVVFLSVLVPLVAFCWLLGPPLVEQVSDLIDKVPEWWRHAVELVRERAPKIKDFVDRYEILDKVEGQQENLVGGLHAALSAGAGFLRGIGKLLGWAVFPVYFSFFLLAGDRQLFAFDQYLPFLKEETRKDVAYLVSEFINVIVAFFRGQLIVAFLQGLLFAVGFSLVGLKYGFVLGLILGFLNIIPYLGSIVGLGLALPIAFFHPDGGVMQVLWVLVVFTVVQIIEGYVLTPKVMGDRTGLHPVMIIVAVFFWGSALGGIMGMILAIPLTAFLVVFWRLAREKYMLELV